MILLLSQDQLFYGGLSYLATLDPFGDRYQEMPDLAEILEQCDLSKPTFYRAIAKLQEVGLFDIQPVKTDFRNLQGLKNRPQRIVSEMRIESQKRELGSTSSPQSRPSNRGDTHLKVTLQAG
jgi:hypothetical protein